MPICTLCEHVACMQWLKNVFLAYLQEWEDEVAQRTEYSAGQRAKMLLSQETMSGLRMTGVHTLAPHIEYLQLTICTSVDGYNDAITIFTNMHVVNLHIIYSDILSGVRASPTCCQRC